MNITRITLITVKTSHQSKSMSNKCYVAMSPNPRTGTIPQFHYTVHTIPLTKKRTLFSVDRERYSLLRAAHSQYSYTSVYVLCISFCHRTAHFFYLSIHSFHLKIKSNYPKSYIHAVIFIILLKEKKKNYEFKMLGRNLVRRVGPLFYQLLKTKTSNATNQSINCSVSR